MMDGWLEIFRVRDKKDFVKEMNGCIPDKKYFEECKKAGKLFGLRIKKDV